MSSCWLVGWLVGWLIGWSVGWLVGWWLVRVAMLIFTYNKCTITAFIFIQVQRLCRSTRAFMIFPLEREMDLARNVGYERQVHQLINKNFQRFFEISM